MSENKPPEAASGIGPVTATDKQETPKTLEDLIREKAPEIFNAIPVGDRPKLAQVTIEQTRISYRSGMLPEPTELAAYNAIIPNGADRIMKMVEAQSSHRISLEATVVSSQQKQEERGQWFALIIALTFGSFGLFAAVNGQPWFGGIIAGTTLVSIVGVFLYSKHQANKELADKRQVALSKTSTPSAMRTPSHQNSQNRRG